MEGRSPEAANLSRLKQIVKRVGRGQGQAGQAPGTYDKLPCANGEAAPALTGLLARCNLPRMTLIERAARALCRLDGHGEDDAREGRPLWQNYVPHVRTVLEEIHEPSPSMMEAGAEVIKYVSPDEAAAGYQGDAANVWRFMIDAMRKDIP